MDSYLYRLPTTIRFGSGVHKEIGDHLRAIGITRPVIVTDPGVRKAGVTQQVVDAMVAAGFNAPIFDGVSGNPRDHEVDACVEFAKFHNADGFVAVGGGSPIDAAKAAAALVTNGGRPRDWELHRPLTVDPLPLIAIPTTSGTGSEVTFVSVITDSVNKFKFTIGDVRLGPKVALVDPDLTLTVPAHVTAATGMDALTHAVEGYTCTVASPITDALALHAIKLIREHIVNAVRDGGNREARTGMMMASTIAGMSFGNADVASVHCVAEAIGGRYDTPHGVANSVFLPPIFAYNAEVAPERHVAVAEALGIDVADRPALDVARDAAALIAQMAKDVGIPSFRELPGVNPEDFPVIAAASVLNGSNPSNSRPMAESDYLFILEQTWNA